MYARHDLGLASEFTANAIGEPGQRHFRLLVTGEGGIACLWLEKEQLLQLAMGIEQLLNGVYQVPNASEFGAPAPIQVTGQELDFQISKLVVGHDQQRDSFLLLAHDQESSGDPTATLGLWATRSQFKKFAEDALTVCAAGRPHCPLCDAPMSQEPHACPRSNGHAPPQE